MQTLLDKTRRMNQLLSRAATEVDFTGSAKVIRDSIDCNVYILDKMGKVLGYALVDDFDCEVMKNEVLTAEEFPSEYNERLFMYRETAVNLKNDRGVRVQGRRAVHIRESFTTILPIMGAGSDWALVLPAFAGLLVMTIHLGRARCYCNAMEILRYNQETVEEETRQRTDPGCSEPSRSPNSTR